MIRHGLSVFALACVLAGCSVHQPAPVRERGLAKPAAVPRSKAPEQRPNAYAVREGDTLYAIALDHGLDYRELARWNALTDPDLIRVGQVLRLTASDAQKPGSVAPTPAGASKSEARPNVPTAGVEEEPAWVWPVHGRLIAGFSVANKGVDIGGERGQAVMAAAPGRVVYAGSGLRAYGKLVIIKHNAAYLTAYAHNREILVKEGETVGPGERIAEMGDTGTSEVKLHFEIRRFGTPVDPLKHLPPP